jgi:hypothetical protein
MVIWFAALAVAGVLVVFRDPKLDHRLVAVGAVLPLPLDLIIGAAQRRVGNAGPFHAVSIHILLLVLAMAISIGKRLRRKRLLAVVIGGFGHLVLDASWADTQRFGWPIVGWGSSARLQIWQRPIWVSLLMELVGVGVAVLLYQRCRLDRPDRRTAFRSTGSLELLPVRRSIHRPANPPKRPTK